LVVCPAIPLPASGLVTVSSTLSYVALAWSVERGVEQRYLPLDVAVLEFGAAVCVTRMLRPGLSPATRRH
jgi:hypothetical protein